jgi:hypothetical protein
MRVVIFLIVIVVSMVGQMWAPINAHAAAQKVVTAAQVNGTWRGKHAEFKVWALGKQRLRVEFSGTYEYKTPYGPMANIGDGAGIAVVEGDTAVFEPDDADDECRITMRFVEGGLIVDQDGTCGFGHNVSAAGTYRKVSGRKPKFDMD